MSEPPYIHVCKENGELIASIPMKKGEVIEQDGYVVVIDHNNTAEFIDIGETIYLDFESVKSSAV